MCILIFINGIFHPGILPVSLDDDVENAQIERYLGTIVSSVAQKLFTRDFAVASKATAMCVRG
ncbi:MAG: hypothetical protein J0H55_11160 [Chitinophagaceae bacterium]|nr:hypothetical protein [Chitinophagaceae bacterium]